MPKFVLVVSNGEHQWEEPYDKPVDDPQAWGEQTIAKFNATLRPGEKPRTLLSVRVIGPSDKHDWEKSNLVTVVRGEEMFDTYRCNKCGVTGKRYGLVSTVIRDPKFKAIKYAFCRSENS